MLPLMSLESNKQNKPAAEFMTTSDYDAIDDGSQCFTERCPSAGHCSLHKDCSLVMHYIRVKNVRYYYILFTGTHQ